MTLKYLIDENVNPLYPNQIRLREPDIVIKVVGETETPPKGTLDPEILCWCEEHQYYEKWCKIAVKTARSRAGTLTLKTIKYQTMLAIIGCGNLNRCDDGVGVLIAQRFSQCKLTTCKYSK
jgi:hypothetical protein